MSPEQQELRTRARQAVATALRHGELTREPCFICGVTRTDAHHLRGYEPEHWLDVVWLCRQHHHREHFAMRSRAAARRLRWIDIRVETGWRERVAAAGSRPKG